MNINIPYGRDVISIDIDSKLIDEIIKPSPLSGTSITQRDIASDEKLIAMANDFLKGKEPTLIVINDHTRPTPSGVIINTIRPLLRNSEDTVFIATGTHRPSTEYELGVILGDSFDVFRTRIIQNDCKNDEFNNLGWTSYGTEVLINNVFERFHKIFTIGSVEPHYFAGFTGGRKSFLPGASSFISIEKNHSHALSKNALPLSLSGNPVNEDMTEFSRFITHRWDVFSVQVVLDRDRSIYSIHYGDIYSSFTEAVDDALSVYSRELSKKYSVVVAIAMPPLDINLYQSLKAVENTISVVEDGGVIILISPCREGVGEENFYNLMSSNRPKEDILAEIRANYTFGSHKSARLIEIMKKHQIWLYSDLDPQVVSKVGFKPIDDLKSAINDAISITDCKSNALVVNDATVMVPTIK